MNNLERIRQFATITDRQKDILNTDRIMTYDYVDNTDVLVAYGGYDRNKTYGWQELLEINARAFRGIGLDMTRSVYDPVHHWMRGKVDNWIRFLGVDQDSWEVEQGGETAWIAKRPFSTLEELKKFLPKMPDRNAIREWYMPFMGNILKTMEDQDVVYIGAVEGPLCDAYTFVDLELFSLLIYDAPDVVKHIIDCCGVYSETLAQAYTELSGAAPIQFMGEDIAGSTGPIFRPDFVEESVLHWWKRIAAPIRNQDGIFIFHTDGQYGKLLDLILGKLGAEGLNPIERNRCNDIFSIYEQYPKVSYFGNVCCAVTLPYGNRYDVEDETLELIEKIGPTGRICIGSSSEVHEQIPLINIETMYAAVHEYGTYPIDIDRIQRRRSEISSHLATRKM
ncbi:MAG: uroporphyrinogen decarboxylase family protein [Sphaerochaeta sp.]|nr:uroporphyrinogen decarboxylase family protein [Sphaerochaeta sp.]